MLLTDSVMWHLNCKFPIVKNATQPIAVKIGVYLKHVRVSEQVMNHTGSQEQRVAEEELVFTQVLKRTEEDEQEQEQGYGGRGRGEEETNHLS